MYNKFFSPIFRPTENLHKLDPKLLHIIKGISSEDSYVAHASLNELSDILESLERQAVLRDYEEIYMQSIMMQFKVKYQFRWFLSISNENYSFKIGQVVVKIDPTYFRPTEVELLIGDNTKAKTKLGWKPKYTLDMLVKEMMEADLILFKKEKYIKELK